MKLNNGKLEFETVTCWQCNGSREVKRFTLCPRRDKAVSKYPKRQCPDCGSKNKHSHKVVGSYMMDCCTCEATGRRLETEYDNLPVEIYKALPISFGNRASSGFVENLLGLGIVGGATDYGRMNDVLKKDGESAVVKKIHDEDTYGRQAITFMKDGKFPTGLQVVVRSNDYSVYPTFA